jgi:hypothetical protein
VLAVDDETKSERWARIIDRALFGRWAWALVGLVLVLALLQYLFL